MTDATTTLIPGDSARKRSRLWQLEALRGAAALYVLLHHISSGYLNWQHKPWGAVFRFGQEGVLVFFLLSGFVICYAHGARGADAGGFRTYLIKRGRRIYPIFILSLAAAYVIQCIGVGRCAPVNLLSLLGNVFMLQDHPDKPGIILLPYADNMPLWSLSYEWWFYMMFYPINRWVPVAKQKYLVLFLCGLGLLANQFIPNTVFYFLTFFLIWWVGVECAREFLATGDVTLRRQRVMLALLAGPTIWYGILLWNCHAAGRAIYFIEFPFVGFRYFLVTAILMLAVFAWKQCRFFGYRQTIGYFEWLGSISYALYVFHYPLICDLRLFKSEAPAIFYTDLCLRVLIAFGLAWLAERYFQKWINSATEPWLTGPVKRQIVGGLAADK